MNSQLYFYIKITTAIISTISALILISAALHKNYPELMHFNSEADFTNRLPKPTTISNNDSQNPIIQVITSIASVVYAHLRTFRDAQANNNALMHSAEQELRSINQRASENTLDNAIQVRDITTPPADSYQLTRGSPSGTTYKEQNFQFLGNEYRNGVLISGNSTTSFLVVVSIDSAGNLTHRYSLPTLSWPGGSTINKFIPVSYAQKNDTSSALIYSAKAAGQSSYSLYATIMNINNGAPVAQKTTRYKVLAGNAIQPSIAANNQTYLITYSDTVNLFADLLNDTTYSSFNYSTGGTLGYRIDTSVIPSSGNFISTFTLSEKPSQIIFNKFGYPLTNITTIPMISGNATLLSTISASNGDFIHIWQQPPSHLVATRRNTNGAITTHINIPFNQPAIDYIDCAQNSPPVIICTYDQNVYNSFLAFNPDTGNIYSPPTMTPQCGIPNSKCLGGIGFNNPTLYYTSGELRVYSVANRNAYQPLFPETPYDSTFVQRLYFPRILLPSSLNITGTQPIQIFTSQPFSFIEGVGTATFQINPLWGALSVPGYTFDTLSGSLTIPLLNAGDLNTIAQQVQFTPSDRFPDDGADMSVTVSAPGGELTQPLSIKQNLYIPIKALQKSFFVQGTQGTTKTIDLGSFFNTNETAKPLTFNITSTDENFIPIQTSNASFPYRFDELSDNTLTISATDNRRGKASTEVLFDSQANILDSKKKSSSLFSDAKNAAGLGMALIPIVSATISAGLYAYSGWRLNQRKNNMKKNHPDTFKEQLYFRTQIVPLFANALMQKLCPNVWLNSNYISRGGAITDACHETLWEIKDTIMDFYKKNDANISCGKRCIQKCCGSSDIAVSLLGERVGQYIAEQYRGRRSLFYSSVCFFRTCCSQSTSFTTDELIAFLLDANNNKNIQDKIINLCSARKENLKTEIGPAAASTNNRYYLDEEGLNNGALSPGDISLA